MDSSWKYQAAADTMDGAVRNMRHVVTEAEQVQRNIAGSMEYFQQVVSQLDYKIADLERYSNKWTFQVLDQVEEILYRETSCIANEDVKGLMDTIRKEILPA